MATNISAYVKPAAWWTSTLYTATGKEIITSILVSNISTATTFSIWYVPLAWSADDTHAFPKTAAIVANDEVDFVRPILLSAWDTIQVSSVSWNVTFALFAQSM